MENHQQKIVFANPYKSPVAGILLSVVLGPIGLLYASFMGSIIMTFLFLIVVAMSFLGVKAGSFCFLLWVISIYWTVAKVNRYNRKINAILIPELGMKSAEK